MTETKTQVEGTPKTLDELSDRELMVQVQDGSVEAFNMLVDEYQERLENYIYGFLKDREEAKDLVQETFLKVFRNRKSYEPISKFSTWIFTIAKNLARSEYKKRKKYPQQSIENAFPDDEGEEENSMTIEDERYRSPEENAHSAIVEDRFVEALKELSEDFRAVIVLRELQEMSYREISQIMDIPEGTVKSRISRARKILQEYLNEIYE